MSTASTAKNRGTELMAAAGIDPNTNAVETEQINEIARLWPNRNFYSSEAGQTKEGQRN